MLASKVPEFLRKVGERGPQVGEVGPSQVTERGSRVLKKISGSLKKFLAPRCSKQLHQCANPWSSLKLTSPVFHSKNLTTYACDKINQNYIFGTAWTRETW